MKNIKLIRTYLFLFTAFILTSCDNEPIDPFIDLNAFGNNNSGVFTALIGSENFNANQNIQAELTDTALGTQLSITGLSSSGKTMSIVIMNPAVGTRTASSNNASLLTFDYAASANDLYSSYNAANAQYNGALTITEFNLTTKKISGTFSFTGYGLLSSTAQIQITNGVLNNISFVNSTAGGNTGGNNNTPPVFKADFNNATWNAATYQAEISGNLIQIVGLKADGSSFGFIVQGSTVGTYPANTNILTYNPPNSEFGYWSTNINNPTENTGSITITNINTTAKTISGTFNFKGYWSNADVTNIPPVQFTNGVFTNIPYINQSQAGDTFFAKVNGTEFVDVDLLAIEIGINGQDYISVGAQNAAMNSMTVSVRNNLGAGTYPITGNTTTDVVQVIYNIGNNDFRGVSGSVTIISKSATRIKGTFNCVTNGVTPFTISEGQFDVEY